MAFYQREQAHSGARCVQVHPEESGFQALAEQGLQEFEHFSVVGADLLSEVLAGLVRVVQRAEVDQSVELIVFPGKGQIVPQELVELLFEGLFRVQGRL